MNPIVVVVVIVVVLVTTLHCVQHKPSVVLLYPCCVKCQRLFCMVNIWFAGTITDQSTERTSVIDNATHFSNITGQLVVRSTI